MAFQDTVVGRALSGGALGARVYQITGKGSDAAAAGGYAAWVQSVTGEAPIVQEQQGRAVVLLTDAQASVMRVWLNRQVMSGVLPGQRKDATLDIAFGPVIAPLALQYVAGVAVAAFLAGFFASRLLR